MEHLLFALLISTTSFAEMPEICSEIKKEVQSGNAAVLLEQKAVLIVKECSGNLDTFQDLARPSIGNKPPLLTDSNIREKIGRWESDFFTCKSKKRDCTGIKAKKNAFIKIFGDGQPNSIMDYKTPLPVAEEPELPNNESRIYFNKGREQWCCKAPSPDRNAEICNADKSELRDTVCEKQVKSGSFLQRLFHRSSPSVPAPTPAQ